MEEAYEFLAPLMAGDLLGRSLLLAIELRFGGLYFLMLEPIKI